MFDENGKYKSKYDRKRERASDRGSRSPPGGIDGSWKNQKADELLKSDRDGYLDREGDADDRDRVSQFTSSKKYTKWGAMKTSAESLVRGRADHLNKDQNKYGGGGDSERKMKKRKDHETGGKQGRNTYTLPMIEVIVDDRMGKRARVKCSASDTVGTLKKLVAAQIGTKYEKNVLKK